MLAAAILLAGGFAFAVYQANLFLAGAKGKIVQKIEAVIPGHSVRMENLSLDWPLAVSAEPVEISNAGGFESGPFARAEKVKVKIGIAALFRAIPSLLRGGTAFQDRQGPESIGSVVIVRPEIFLARKEGEWNIPAVPKREKKSSLSVRVEVVEGKVQIQDDQKIWEGAGVKSASGFVDLNPADPRLSVRIVTSADETLTAKGNLNSANKFAGEIETKGLGALNYLAKLKPMAGPLSIGNDRLDSETRMEAEWPVDFADLKNARVSGTTQILNYQAALRFEELELPLSASGEIAWTPEKVEFKPVELKANGSNLKLEGDVHGLKDTPELAARLSGAVGLEDVKALFPKFLKPRGSLSVTADASGPLKEPRAAIHLKTSGAALADKNLELEARLKTSSKTLSLESVTGSWGEASINAVGTLSELGFEGDATLANLPLEYFSEGPQPKAGGTATLKLKSQPLKGVPLLAGQVSIKNFYFFQNKLGNLSGRFRGNRSMASFNLASANYKSKLVLETEHNDESVTLKQFSISLENNQSLKVTGQLDRKTRAIAGAVAAEGVAFPTLGDPLKFLAFFDGKISVNGKFSGTLDEPVLNGSLRASDVYFRDREIQAEPVGNFSSKFQWTQDAMEFPAFAIGSSYKGSIHVKMKPEKSFVVDASAQDANPKVLFAILNLNPDVGGTLSGTAVVEHQSGDGKNPRAHHFNGKADLKIANGYWSKAAFDSCLAKAEFSDDLIKVLDFRMVQKSGLMTLKGEAEQTGLKNPLRLSGNLKNFMIAKTRLDGNCSLNGELVMEEKIWINGELASGNFKINGLGLGKIKGNLEWKDKTLAVENLSAGQIVQGNLKVTYPESRKESPSLEGRWRSSLQPVQQWAQLMEFSTPPVQGMMSISGTLSGQMKSPEFKFTSEFADLKIVSAKMKAGDKSLEGFRGNGSAIFNEGFLKSLSVTLHRKEDEKITLLGQANLGSRELSIEAAINRIDSSVLFYPLGLKDFEGPMDGKLLIQGDWEHPVLKAEVKGQGGQMGDIQLDTWDAAGTFKEKEFSFTRLNAQGYRNSWRFTVLENSWIKPLADGKSGTYRLNTDFANVSIGPVALVGQGTLEGNWAPGPGGQGPLFSGSAKLTECTANNFELKPTRLALQYYNKVLKFTPGEDDPSVTGSIDFSNAPCVVFSQLAVTSGDKRLFFMDGELCNDQPAFKMEGAGVDATFLTGVFGSPIPMTGPADFKIEGLRVKGQAVIQGELSLKNGKVHEVPLETLDSKFIWKEGLFNLQTLEAKSKQYFNVNASGSFPAKWGSVKPSTSKIDFSLKCTDGNLAFLNSFESDLVKNTKGSFSGQLSVKGNTVNPVLNGFLKISEGEGDSKYLTRSLQKLELSLQIKSNKITIQKAEAEAGGARLKMNGDVVAAFDGGDLLFDNFNLQLQTPGKVGLPIQIPEMPAIQERLGIPSTPSKGSVLLALTLTGTSEKPKIGGQVILDDVLFSYPPPKSQARERHWFDNAEWDIALKTGKRTMFQNDVAYVKLDGQLQLKGVKDRLEVRGKLTSHEGSITFLGAKFELRDATLEVVPPTRMALGQTGPSADELNVAYLSLRAEQRTPVYIGGEQVQDLITMQLDRTPLTEQFDSKKITFRSSARPNLASEKVVSSVAGTDSNLENLTPEERDVQFRQGMARILDSQLASPIAKSVLQTIGIADRIEITQDADYSKDGRKARSSSLRGDETSSVLDPFIGQSLLVEKTFASKLGVGYKATFDKIKDRTDFIHQLQLRYPFYRGIYFIGSTELDSEENLGRQRERYGGIETRVRFEFSDLYKWMKKDVQPEPKKPE